MSPRIPENHPLRLVLHDEAHARPPEELVAPSRLTFLALSSDPSAVSLEHRLVSGLCERFGQPAPGQNANHHIAALPGFRLKWERHTEFTRYMFIVDGEESEPFGEPAIAAAPPGWVESLPGRVLMAAHAVVVNETEPVDTDLLSIRFFRGNPLVGSAIAGGAAAALTDFRIGEDGFSRLLILNRSMSRRQAGRMVQRLLEAETYRILALLALPVARELAPILEEDETQLASITAQMTTAKEEDEPELLDRLTKVSADVEKRLARSHSRFSAAEAYWELVESRLAAVREERLPGLQTFREFTERRLAPAMSTCRWVSASQESLSGRISRASQLLATRVDISRERQNQTLLASMDRRARLQLRLQETVEGLSVAAITYYLAGLAGYGAKALKALGAGVNPDLVTGLAIPVAAAAVWAGVRQVRKIVQGSHGTAHPG